MYVKCYTGNYDGKRRGLIIANSQKKAAEIAKCSLHGFRQYWGFEQRWPKDFNPEPYVLYTKRYDSKDGWVKGRCP